MAPSELCLFLASRAQFKITQLGPYGLKLNELGIHIKLSESSFKPNKNHLKILPDDKVMAKIVMCAQF